MPTRPRRRWLPTSAPALHRRQLTDGMRIIVESEDDAIANTIFSNYQLEPQNHASASVEMARMLARVRSFR